MRKKAIILTQRNVQDHEFIYPYYRLQEAGYKVDVATDDGKETTGILGTKISVNKKISAIKASDYDLLVLPGGAKAMEYMRQHPRTLKFIKDWDKAGRPIGAICHAPQLLISANGIKGRRISGYYSLKDDINNAGGKYVDAPVVVDGNIASSPHYKYLGDWMKVTLALAEKLNKRR